MAETFPYQLVGFLDKRPSIGERIYNGPENWYPQIVLKRRFNIVGMSEDELLQKIKTFCASMTPLVIYR